MTEYKQKIETLLDEMSDIAKVVRLANRGEVNTYMQSVRSVVQDRLENFLAHPDHASVLLRFESYVNEEENRLRDALTTAKYDIDSAETLAAINGRKGLERVCTPSLHREYLRTDWDNHRICFLYSTCYSLTTET